MSTQGFFSLFHPVERKQKKLAVIYSIATELMTGDWSKMIMLLSNLLSDIIIYLFIYLFQQSMLILR